MAHCNLCPCPPLSSRYNGWRHVSQWLFRLTLGHQKLMLAFGNVWRIRYAYANGKTLIIDLEDVIIKSLSHPQAADGATLHIRGICSDCNFNGKGKWNVICCRFTNLWVCKLLVCVSHWVMLCALYNVNCEIRKKKFIWKYFLSD